MAEFQYIGELITEVLDALSAKSAEADEAGMLLLLRPLPYDSNGPDREQLADWYSRFGFDVLQRDPLLMARAAGAEPRFRVKPLVFTMAEAIA